MYLAKCNVILYHDFSRNAKGQKEEAVRQKIQDSLRQSTSCILMKSRFPQESPHLQLPETAAFL